MMDKCRKRLIDLILVKNINENDHIESLDIRKSGQIVKYKCACLIIK